MYRGRFWTMRQYAGFGTAIESNQRYRYLLSKGQAGLSVAFDLPTQIGMDSDHPLALGEVGKVGVAIDSLEDMEMLSMASRSKEFHFDDHQCHCGHSFVPLCRGCKAARRQFAKLSGTVQNDILRNTSLAAPTSIPCVRRCESSPTFRVVPRHLPKWNTISISGYHIREAGSTAVQEVAFTLADGIAYVQPRWTPGSR